MKLYLAAPWVRKAAARVAKGYCLRRGLYVVSTWTEQPDDEDPAQALQTQQHYAQSDWNELMDADALMMLFPEVRSAGKATELGAALAMQGRMRFPIVIVGTPVPGGNIFYHLPHIHWEDTVPHAVDWLLNARLPVD